MKHKDYSWIDKVKGGKRTSPYTAPVPKKKKQRRGNVSEVIRDRYQRMDDLSRK